MIFSVYLPIFQHNRNGLKEVFLCKCWISHITHFSINNFEIFCIYQACLYISYAFLNFDMGSIKHVSIYFLKKCLKSHIDHALKHFDILGTACTLWPICIFFSKCQLLELISSILISWCNLHAFSHYVFSISNCQWSKLISSILNITCFFLELTALLLIVDLQSPII